MSAIPPVPRPTLGKTGLSIPVIPVGTQGVGTQFGFVSDADVLQGWLCER